MQIQSVTLDWCLCCFILVTAIANTHATLQTLMLLNKTIFAFSQSFTSFLYYMLAYIRYMLAEHADGDLYIAS